MRRIEFLQLLNICRLACRLASSPEQTGRTALFLILWAVAGTTNSPAIAANAEHRAAKAPINIPWLITSEDQPWSMALAAPVASRLQQSGPKPLLMAVTSPLTREADWLLSAATGPRPIVFTPSGSMKLGAILKRRSPELLQIGNDPGAASATLARRFWAQSREVVVASTDDPDAVILGSALAAGLGVPLLLSEKDEICPAVASALRELSVKRMLVAASDPKRAPQWIRRQPEFSNLGAAVVLGPEALEHRLIAALGVEKIRNVVVARAPDVRLGVGHSAWLAPYASFARGAPLVLAHAPGPAVAEAEVQGLIERESLQPRTVTILADYASIGYRNVEIDPNLQDDGRDEPATAIPPPSTISGGTAAAPAPPQPYSIRAEPFVTTQSDQLAKLGVGRIPLESLGDASVFYVRGLLRERLLANRPSRLLMVANSSPGPRGLPMCEAISRNTAAEFKNFRLHVDEFYGQQTDSPDVLTAARTANLILYEGHLSHQELIDAPVLHRTPAQDYPLDEEDLEGVAGPSQGPNQGPSRGTDRDPGAPGRPAARVVAAESASQHLQGPLEGLPIVVLQSCESLDDAVLWRLDELGGAALIGSVTPIHSGCGSDMLHSAMTSLLYRGGTLGEALRDAQNYMFCVEELKARRGHKEMAKGLRVAMSFRLWGDPEMQVLPAGLGPPLQPPVRAEWISGDTLRIHMPDKRLPDARSNKYLASMFPNSQAAGLVKIEPSPSPLPVGEGKGEGLKRILPFYYFCLPLPQGFAKSGATRLEPSRSEARRVYARIDRSRGLLHLVYYPEQENPGESVDLRLHAVAPAEPARRLAK